MKGMLYNLEGKSLLEVSDFASKPNCKKEGSFASIEPISVLDTRRSPSPSTSTSTLSSLGGGGKGGGEKSGGGSTDNIASPKADSDTTLHQKWPGSDPSDTGSGHVTELAGGGGGRKDEWVAVLQAISGGFEGGAGNSQRFGGFGLEELESLLSESGSPGQDPFLLRWISGDVEDSSFSLKQLLQSGNYNEIDCNVGFGVNEQSWGFESSAGAGSGSGFSLNNNNNGKLGSVPNSSCLNNNFNPQNPFLSSSSNSLPLSPGIIYQTPDQKPQVFNPQVQSTSNPNVISSLSYNNQPLTNWQNLIIGKSSSQNSNASFVDSGHELLLRKQQQLAQMQQPQLGFANQLNLVAPPQLGPQMGPRQEAAAGGGSSEEMAALHCHHQQEVIYDQLCKVVELILAGNFAHAQVILARLNHQLSPIAKPFHRAAFYFKEALQISLLMPNQMVPTPFDGMFRMDAYRLFSDVSPLIKFMNFTSNQALLEAIEDVERVHIVDFDIGFGAQWASFIQELPRRKGVAPSLKITAFASPTTHHHFEIGLMHESLTHFAHEIGITFELEVVNFDSFDPNSYLVPSSRLSKNEAIVVNFPIWSSPSHLSDVSSLLRFIKQLSPKVMVSLDCGCERTELPFSQHLLHSLQYYEVLFDSIDAANVTSDTANTIERFLFQPRVESMILGRLHFPEQIPHWKTLFASAGFSPVAFSNFAATQAEYLVTQARGFHVEKRKSSLALCWQRQVLMLASAWKC